VVGVALLVIFWLLLEPFLEPSERRRMQRLTLFSLLLAGTTACATVPAGHAGVLLRASGVAPEPLAEGAHFVGPLARVDLYDLRAGHQSEDLVALAADGAELEARASVLTFHPAPGELVALAREVGPDYYGVLIRPVVRSAVRRVLAGLRADQLDMPGVARAEREITRITAERLRPCHIVFDAIDLRTLALSPASAGYHAVVETSVAEQQALAARNLVELARRRADERRVDARGIAASHVLLAPTLTPQTLDDGATRAWTQLLTARSTTVQVVPSDLSTMLEVSP
jgi:regulator of protease activity HflC (stomatin/prohibitin superfamily)